MFIGYKTVPEAVITGIHQASAHYGAEEMIGMKIYEVRYSYLQYIEDHWGDKGWFSIYYRTADGRPGCIFGGRIQAPEPTWEI